MRLTLVVLLFIPLLGLSQVSDSLPSNKKNKTRLYAEVFGSPNTFISLNYERILLASKNKKTELTFRTGFGYSFFKHYDSHLYSLPFELNGLIGGNTLKLDIGLAYVQEYRSEAIDENGTKIFNGEKGFFYHYSVRIGGKISGLYDGHYGLFARMSIGKNFTPEKIKRNYSGEESNSSKLITEGLFGLAFGIFF